MIIVVSLNDFHRFYKSITKHDQNLNLENNSQLADYSRVEKYLIYISLHKLLVLLKTIIVASLIFSVMSIKFIKTFTKHDRNSKVNFQPADY